LDVSKHLLHTGYHHLYYSPKQAAAYSFLLLVDLCMWPGNNECWMLQFGGISRGCCVQQDTHYLGY